MKNKKAKNRDQNIFETLSYSEWFENECKRIKKIYDDSPHDLVIFEKELKKLIKFIPSNWEASIRKYILGGNLELPFIKGTKVIFKKNFVTGETKLYLQIFKRTTQKDVIQVWDKVKKLQKKMNELWAPSIPKQNKDVFKIWQEVESREKKPRQIAREVAAILCNYGCDLAENTITKIVSNMRKQLHAVKKGNKK
jgi:hypothetical protein